MTPAAFTFKLSVPRDPAVAVVVSDLVQHAVVYAAMSEDAGAAFMQQVKAATATELAGGKGHCVVVIAAAGGELKVTLGSQALSQPISA